jgi:hypothetical protein
MSLSPLRCRQEAEPIAEECSVRPENCYQSVSVLFFVCSQLFGTYCSVNAGLEWVVHQLLILLNVDGGRERTSWLSEELVRSRHRKQEFLQNSEGRVFEMWGPHMNIPEERALWLLVPWPLTVGAGPASWHVVPVVCEMNLSASPHGACHLVGTW